MVVLRASGLCKRYGRRQVLVGVELEVEAGARLGLIGPNGAGKTTCLRMMAGLLRGEGEVWLCGASMSGLGLAARARLGLGYLSQGGSAFGGLTVWENLRSVPGAGAKARAEVLSRVGLEARRGDLAGSLSGGERRRLEIGRLLLLPSLSVLLCDEPFAALDPAGVTAVSGLLREVAGRGCAVVVTDHHVDAVFELCDDVALLLDGAVARRGAPEALRGDPGLRRYLGV